MQLVGGKRTEPLWLYAVAGALMVGGPMWRELYVNHYPLRPEVFALTLVAAATGTIVAAGSWLVGGFVGTAAFGGLLFVFADLQLDPQHWTYTAVVLAGCVALAQLLFSHRAAISTLALGAFFLSSLARPPIAPPPERLDTSGPARPSNPLLVHIVLDEQWGVGGLRAAGDTVTAAFLTEYYLKRGFELYEAAYSHQMQTEESLQSMMLLGQEGADRVPGREAFMHSVRRNPYFARLHELGYAIHVDQTTFIDFCNGETAVASCQVQSGNSISNIGYLDGSWVTRGIWALRYFVSTRSHVFARLVPGPEGWRRALAGGGLAAMRRLATAIASRPPGGTAWFLHVQFPHRPYQTDEDCRIQTSPSRYLDYGLPAQPGDSLWRAALGVYADQVRCTHRALAGVIDAIDSTVGRDRSIVIVHGDHGSRLHPHDRHDMKVPLEAYSRSELNAHFATLLAVRRPQTPATLHREPTPIQDVIWELARHGFSGVLPGTWPHYISKMPDRAHATRQLRPLAPSDMPWVSRPD